MLPFTTVSQLLADNMTRRSDSVAFIEDERVITYREFDRMVQRSAAWLAAQGVKPGDRVAVWLVNRIEWMALYFGLARLGAALMTVNTRYRSHELAYILQRSQASLLVLQLNFRKIDFPAVLRDVPAEAATALRKVVVVGAMADIPAMVLDRPAVAFDLANLPEAQVPDQTLPDAPSILFTTSGTTSNPKLVQHSQRTVTLHSQHIARASGLKESGARLLTTLPFCGVFGFSAALATFAAGQPIVLMDTFDGAAAAALIGRHAITHIFGSDEMFRLLLERASGDRPFPSARMFGFASFHPGILDLTQNAWARGVPMIGLYGASEVQALFSLQSPDLPLKERIQGGGRPVNPNAEIRVRDAETGQLLPVGQSGALEIRADTNFIGYLNDQQATAKSIDTEGFYRTGDMGYLRGDGSFVYQARHDDAMRLSGFLVNPAEIEDVIKTVPGVRNAQVVAVDTGEQMRPVAFVIAAPGTLVSEQDILKTTAKVLASFKVPVHVWFVDEYPVTQSSNGTKIQRIKLRDMAAQRLAPTA